MNLSNCFKRPSATTWSVGVVMMCGLTSLPSATRLSIVLAARAIFVGDCNGSIGWCTFLSGEPCAQPRGRPVGDLDQLTI